MNFKDQWATDEQGESFIFTVEMQRRLSQAGLPVEPASLDQLEEDNGSKPAGGAQRSRAPRVESTQEEIEAPATIQIDPQTGKYVGRMKWYNTSKGYGFIIRGAGEEIFFHKTGVAGDPDRLQEGQWVLYDVEETHKGPEAAEVEPYEGDVDLLE